MTAALCPHNHGPSSGPGWCLWYDAMNISSNLTWWFHLLPTTPSDRRLGDFEIAMKQSRYDMMKDSSIEIRFGSEICLLSLMFVCCAGDHVHHDSTSTDLVLVFPCLYELYRDGVAMTRMTVLQRGIGSMERAEVRDQPELHLTITESLYKVFVRLPGRVSQFLHQYRQY